MATMSALRIQPVPRSRVDEIEFANLGFSQVFSDHMVLAEYRDGAWGEPEILPYGPLPIPPSASSLQYGVSIFEGMKAHRTPAGEVVLFRPWDNAKRLNRSAARMAMPEVPEELFLETLRELVRLDHRWVPPYGSGALYIRPCLFSIDPSLRVKPADRFLFNIVTSPYGSYFSVPVAAHATEKYVRAFPGGTGNVKPAANYAPSLLAEREAVEAGCHTVLWLDGQEHRYVEECGLMNVFFVVDDRVLTPELGGTILPGLTRDTAIRLLRDQGFVVEEGRIAIDQLIEWNREGRIRECFGTGTAATLSPIARIRYRDEDLILPPVEGRTIGPALRSRLVDLMSGAVPDPYGWLDPVR